MKECPDDLFYTEDHEWVKYDRKSKSCLVGITDYAQDKLGDIVHVELPEEGEEIKKHDPMGSVESVKAVSDVYCPIEGTIVEVNSLLQDSPEVLNEDCYGEAWIARVEVEGEEVLEGLMDSKEYVAFIENEG